MKPLELVVAADERRGIGKGGALPWRLPGEMAYFKRLTSSAAEGLQNAVIMGRKTYESIAPKFRPLAGRLNIVITRDRAFTAEGAVVVHSLEAARTYAEAAFVDHAFVIGGGQIYTDALASVACRRVYLTRVHAQFDCDTQLPAFESEYHLVSKEGPHREGGLGYSFAVWERNS